MHVSGGSIYCCSSFTKLRLSAFATLRRYIPGVHNSTFLRYATRFHTLSNLAHFDAEEKVKILTSQVHPLDGHSVPYNFSSTISPLLHNAARALNLPARSRETFQSAFGVQSTTSSSSRANGDNVAPVDVQHTGHILVSGYHISYVLPKVFPQQSASRHFDDTEADTVSRLSLRNRRSSMGDRSHIQYMAAIDMWVPFVSRPPRSPYLVSPVLFVVQIQS